MRKIRLPFLLSFIILCSLSAIAQEPNGKFDEWGKVTIDDLKVTECSFEKNADAIALLDLGQIFFSKNNPTFYFGSKYLVTSAYYRRYKIFSEKGINKATFKQTLNMGLSEQLKNIRAVCYNLVNGTIQKTELKPADIHKSKLDENHEQVTFTIPGVKQGSVFEINYEREQEVAYTLPLWSFTSDIPTIKSQLTVGFLNPLIYYIDKHVMEGLLSEKSTPFSTEISIPSGAFATREIPGIATTYTISNIHSFESEPYINSSRNYRNWICFQLMALASPLNENAQLVNNFKTFIQHVLDDGNFGSLANGPGIPKKYWASLITENMTDEQKAKAIFDFVRANMKWNGFGGIFPGHNAAALWKDKTGSNTEINLLLLSTLKQANLTAYPMLITARANGYINKNFPIMDQYKGANVLLDLGNNNFVVMDATEKYLPFGFPSFDQLRTSGLVIRGADDYYWYMIKDKVGNREYTSIKGQIDEEGHITGQISMMYNNYVAQDLIDDRISGKGTAWNEMVKELIPTASIESTKDSFDVDNCRFFINIKFSAQAPTDNDGNLYLSVPTVYGSTASPLVNSERTADVDFGCKSRSDVMMQIRIPDSYVVDSIVPNVSLKMQDSSMSFVYNAEMSNGEVSIRQKMERTATFYSVGTYSALYDFFQKYYAIKQRPVILKRKK